MKAEAAEQVQRVVDEVTKEKEKLQKELEAERVKVKDADDLLRTICDGKT